jgi:hypothetical protein
MSNIITPLTNVDFTASLAELIPFLEDRIIAMPSSNDWSDVYFLMAASEDMTETFNILAELNLSILNIVYIETQGGNEYYQGATPNSCIILPLTASVSRTINAYSAPLGTAGLSETYPVKGYHAEDCTLIESHAVTGPVFIGSGSVLEDAELVYSFQTSEGTLYKSIVILVNEDTLPVI